MACEDSTTPFVGLLKTNSLLPSSTPEMILRLDPRALRAFTWAGILLIVASVSCQEDDDLVSDKEVQALMRAQRQRDKERAAALAKANIAEVTTRSSYIHKPRGELTGDLLRHHLIADFVFDVPFIVVSVEWVLDHFADLGNKIPVNIVDDPPYWVDWKGNETEWYTFIMSDLDEPSREKPTLREYQHWIVVNIPGNDIRKGETLVSYKGPDPGKGTGVHRHGIVVYKQPGKLTFKEKPIRTPNADHRRGNFSNIQFAEKYHFGEPVAINFFQTEWGPPPTLPPEIPESLILDSGRGTRKAKVSPTTHVP